MDKLRLGALPDDRPVKLTVTLSAALVADLATYGVCLAKASGEPEPVPPDRLIGPMLTKFLATDRAFAKLRRALD